MLPFEGRWGATPGLPETGHWGVCPDSWPWGRPSPGAWVTPCDIIDDTVRTELPREGDGEVDECGAVPSHTGLGTEAPPKKRRMSPR